MIYRANEVFVAGRMPDLTYVSRKGPELEVTLQNARYKSHKLIVITGNTKSGKTVLARLIFRPDECVWLDGGSITSEDDLWTSILSHSDSYTTVSEVDGRGSATGGSVTVSDQANIFVAKA